MLVRQKNKKLRVTRQACNVEQFFQQDSTQEHYNLRRIFNLQIYIWSLFKAQGVYFSGKQRFMVQNEASQLFSFKDKINFAVLLFFLRGINRQCIWIRVDSQGLSFVCLVSTQHERPVAFLVAINMRHLERTLYCKSYSYLQYRDVT